MITFNAIAVPFNFSKIALKKWLQEVAVSENKAIAHLNYVFCNDSYLLGVNQKFLNHDTYTDIITFDNSFGDFLSADIYISIDRVAENATISKTAFDNELLRVIVHGVLHLCGYKDKTKEETALMRLKEDEKVSLFHVER